ncbi:unnamed protein product [Bursaphelenchus okinawaensis]|uniref:Transcription initiation factor IIF subunit alpha n=1 Tax=Bursaphelenchus okinawaensis TaxID=465554 RepID=A0A811K288_9BILA|nr:unnamed protein product [Bursaphelenchus okinawaensis]CAG9090389.1 unnamed protein product [Bursaphelenchus okinawaensis]
MSAVPQRSHQADAGQAQRPVNEFKVVIPENKDAIRYSILQFNGPLNIDPSRWTTCDLKMFREDNRAHAVGTTAIVQDYGEGSEYGRAAREEARRKKYGRQSKKYQHDRQPWRMVLKDPTKEPQERVFRSVCEGGAGEHSDYWIFSKSGDSFQAHKVDDWYRFMPTARHKTLDIDQAEEQFQLRNKVLNQFALKAKIQQTLKDAEEDNGLVTKPTALKIKDDFSDSDEEGGHAEKDESKGILDADAALEKNPKKKKGKQKDKRQRVENAEEVARYESEDGEDEGREYDYMSDSGSDTRWVGVL